MIMQWVICEIDWIQKEWLVLLPIQESELWNWDKNRSVRLLSMFGNIIFCKVFLWFSIPVLDLGSATVTIDLNAATHTWISLVATRSDGFKIGSIEASDFFRKYDGVVSSQSPDSDQTSRSFNITIENLVPSTMYTVTLSGLTDSNNHPISPNAASSPAYCTS